MALNPLILILTAAIIAAGVFIRLKRHPVIPVITLFSLIAVLMLIICLFIIDNTVLPTDPNSESSSFLIKLIVWGYDGTQLTHLYSAFNVLKIIVITLLFSAQLSLFVETGLVLRHKKERN